MSNTDKKYASTHIRCPYCGYEYSIAEIYYPDDLVGSENPVIRNSKNEITYSTGNPPNLDRDYTCDNCSKSFQVSACQKFITKKLDELKDADFEECIIKIN